MNTPEFDTALRQSAASMTRLYPGERLRIDRGLVLALNGAAFLDGDHWKVRSATDAEVVYVITPEGCDCPDGKKAPDGRCKHTWSVYLTQTAQLKETPHVEDE